MSDPVTTGLVILGLERLGGKEALEKLFGPTLEYFGGEIRDFSKICATNVRRILTNAVSKAGSSLDTPGSIPPKVIKELLNEGPFVNDELAAEYFGGVLASSRSGVERDDRGASFLKLVSAMSSYELRAHYIFYKIARMLFTGKSQKTGLWEVEDRGRIFIHQSCFIQAMEFTGSEDYHSIVSHITFGLHQQGLIGNFQFGAIPSLGDRGVYITPSPRGAELFLWANGLGKVPISAFYSPTIQTTSNVRVSLSPAFCSFSERMRFGSTWPYAVPSSDKP